MGAAILSDLVTEILIPIAAVIGIAFSLVQWLLVAKVKLSPEAQSPGAHGEKKNGYSDYLIEEEEGLNDHNVVVKCAEIQNAISEGELKCVRVFYIYIILYVDLVVVLVKQGFFFLV